MTRQEQEPREQYNLPNRILLEEELFPFADRKKIQGYPFPSSPNRLVELPFCLLIGNQLFQPILRINLWMGAIWHNISFTPFAPEAGYQITTEDFSLETRLKKMVDLDRRASIKNPKAPLLLEVYIPNEELIRVGLVKKKPTIEGYGLELNLQAVSFLEALRCQITFPNQSYESRLAFSQLDHPHPVLSFTSFYPSDFGPLPNNQDITVPIGYWRPSGAPSGFLVGPGHSIFLPDDEEELAQIGMTFLLAPRHLGEG